MKLFFNHYRPLVRESRRPNCPPRFLLFFPPRIFGPVILLPKLPGGNTWCQLKNPPPPTFTGRVGLCCVMIEASPESPCMLDLLPSDLDY